jgi:hypothetical protein
MYNKVHRTVLYTLKGGLHSAPLLAGTKKIWALVEQQYTTLQEDARLLLSLAQY